MKKTEGSFRIAQISWMALLVLCVAWELWLAPLREGGTWLWLKAVPIALTLPGLARGQLRTLQAALLISALYLVEGCVRLFEADGVRVLALLELFLVLVFFVSAVRVLHPLKPIKQKPSPDLQRSKEI